MRGMRKEIKIGISSETGVVILTGTRWGIGAMIGIYGGYLTRKDIYRS